MTPRIGVRPRASFDFRETLAAEASAVFGVPVCATDRLARALAETDDPEGEYVASSVAVLGSALNAQPAIAGALRAAGVDIERLRLPPRYPVRRVDVWQQSVRDQLEVWFRRRPRTSSVPSSATQAWDDVVRTGELSLSLVLRACLESRYLDDTDAYDRPSENDMVHELGRCAPIRRVRASVPNVPGPYLERKGVARLCDRITRALGRLPQVDSDIEDQQWLLIREDGKVRVRPFAALDVCQVPTSPFHEGSLWLARANVIQPWPFLEETIYELEELINDPRAPERLFQEFFTRHPQFLIALGPYASARPHAILHAGKKSHVPDFFLERVDGTVDICDLKRPSQRIVVDRHREPRLSFGITKLVAQLERYESQFDDETMRDEFRSRYGLAGYRPRVVAIVGRNSEFDSGIQRRHLEKPFSDWLAIRTYDDVLEAARAWMNVVAKTTPD